MQTYEPRPTNPYPQTQSHKIAGAHQTTTHNPRPSVEHNHWQSTLIGKAQREREKKEVERGKRKIEEREPDVNKK